MNDQIEIRRLQVPSQIGVPDEERAQVQTLLVSAVMIPAQGFENLRDDISRTIDYAEVAEKIKELGAAGERRLIETFAREIANFLLINYPLAEVEILLEKYILPDAESVAVRVRRVRST